MINQISDNAPVKTIDSDNRLKTKQQEVKTYVDDTSSFDNVSISSTSKQLDALKNSLRDISEINEARVLYFKAEIELGNYQIDSDKIAMKMFNNVELA